MMAAARRANVGARVELDRRDASMQRDPHADLEARFETLEAAVAALARKLDDVESVADYAAERAEAAA